MIRRFRVGSPSAGTRLDVFLVAACSDMSRSRLQKLIAEGSVRVDGGAARRSHVVRAGEEISVDVPEPREVAVEAEDIPLSILYEDAHLHRDRQAGRPGRASRARPRVRHARQRSSPLRSRPLGDRRRAAPGDRPSPRSRHLRRSARGEDRPRPPDALASDAAPHPSQGVPRARRRGSPRAQGRSHLRDRPRSARPQEDEGVPAPRNRRRAPCRRPRRPHPLRDREGVADARTDPASLPARDGTDAPDPRPPRGLGSADRRRSRCTAVPAIPASPTRTSAAGWPGSRARPSTPSASSSIIRRRRSSSRSWRLVRPTSPA